MSTATPQIMFGFTLLLLISSFNNNCEAFTTSSAPAARISLHSGPSIATVSLQKLVDTTLPPIALYAAAEAAAAADDRDVKSTSGSEAPEAAVEAAECADSDDDDAITTEGLNEVFDSVDVDGSGAIDLEEFNRHLTPVGFSSDAIEASFSEMDKDNNGEISRNEFRQAIIDKSEKAATSGDDGCPMGYFMNSVQQTCQPLGPFGRISQRVETLGPFKKTYNKISNLFGVDTKNISKLGVSFALAYSIISNLNGAITFSVAWYISCRRTGLSPLVPGQWKTLLSSYAMIYGFAQIVKPFRVAAAIAMSKLSAEYLEMTQAKLKCSRGVAIGCQYLMGQVIMAICAFIGVSIVTVWTGVPMFGVAGK